MILKQNKMVVTGGSGLLSNKLKIIPSVYFHTHEEFNISDYDQMNKFLKGREFDYLPRVTAFTFPPRVDENLLKVIDINITRTTDIVGLCIKHGLKLIYISTDYVLKENKGNYREDVPLYLVNKYAISKLSRE